MSGALHIRIASEADAEALLAIYAPYVEHTAITFEYEVPDLEEFRGRIRQVLRRYPWLAAEDAGGIVGYAYAGPFKTRAAYDWAVETSIYVRQDRKRQGAGRRLYQALEDILRLQGILNVNACIACPAVEDEYLTRDSVAFHQRLGYRLVGEFHQCGYKFDRWYNMVWMEKSLGDHLADQPPIVPFPQVRSRLRELPGLS